MMPVYESSGVRQELPADTMDGGASLGYESKMYSNDTRLILASASPRRRQFFNDLGLSFEVVTADLVEEPAAGEMPSSFVRRMALEKARAVCERHPDAWIVSGDTVVCLDQRILGKPGDFKEAVEMLLLLAGREHLVETAFCLCHRNFRVEVVRSVRTKVRFAPFDEATAQAYAATGECFDKAGAYGIQGKGSALVQAIEGSYSNVVGLPLCELLQALLEHRVIRLVDLFDKSGKAS